MASVFTAIFSKRAAGGLRITLNLFNMRDQEPNTGSAPQS